MRVALWAPSLCTGASSSLALSRHFTTHHHQKKVTQLSLLVSNITCTLPGLQDHIFSPLQQKEKTCITDRPINHQKHQITTPSTHSFYQQVDEIRRANIEEPKIKHSQTHSCITHQPFDTAKVAYKSPFCLYSGTLYIKFTKPLT
jgi:hypothetical protein